MMETVENVDYTKEKDVLKTDTLEYIAGFMQYATRDKTYKISEDEHEEDLEGDQQLTFLDLVNEGGLIKPPKDLVKHVEVLEKVFRGTTITCRDIYSTLLNKSTELIKMSVAMKKRFFKTRINARIRYLNRQIAIYYAKKRAASLAKGQTKTAFKSGDKSATQTTDLTVNHNNSSKTERKIKKFSTYLFCFIFTNFILSEKSQKKINSISELVTSLS